MHVDIAKIQVIHDSLSPMTLIDLCIFLGLAEFYHSFMLGVSGWIENKCTKITV
jgi:hypothetical protein